MKNLIKQYFKSKKQRDTLKRYTSMGAGTILQRRDCLDFRLTPEDRKYVTIGERGIIKAQFTFETPQGEVRIGNNSHIGGAQFICRTRIEVGNDVTMAWGITGRSGSVASRALHQRAFSSVSR